MVYTVRFSDAILVCDCTYLVNTTFDDFWVEMRNLFQIGIFAPHGLCNLNNDKKNCTNNLYTEFVDAS